MAKIQPFSAQVRQTGKVVTIDLHGEVDSFANNRLHEAYIEVEQLDPPVILLNFSDVSYINSTGIALIVGLLAQARKTQRKVYVYGLSDHYVTIFQITRLADFMSIYPNEDSALADAAALG